MKKESLRATGGLNYQDSPPKVIAACIPVNLQTSVFWNSDDGDLRIQVHTPERARRLARVRGVRLVAYSVHGPYCRIFTVSKPPRWAMGWIRRALLTSATFDALTVLRSSRLARPGPPPCHLSTLAGRSGWLWSCGCCIP